MAVLVQLGKYLPDKVTAVWLGLIVQVVGAHQTVA